MSPPWFRMEGSVLRFRPVHRHGWTVVMLAAAVEVLLAATAIGLLLGPASRALTLVPVLFMPLIAAALLLIIAARVARPERT